MDGYIQARRGTYTSVARSRKGTEKTGQKLKASAWERVYKVYGSTKARPEEKGNA